MITASLSSTLPSSEQKRLKLIVWRIVPFEVQKPMPCLLRLWQAASVSISGKGWFSGLYMITHIVF